MNLNSTAPPAGPSTGGESLTTVQMSSLRIGARLKSGIFEDRDDRSVLLLSAGSTLTRGIIASLARRGISSVKVRSSEVARLVTNGVAPSSPIASAASPADKSSDADMSVQERRSRSDTTPYGRPDDPAVVQRFAESHRECVEQIDGLMDRLTQGDCRDGAEVVSISEQGLLEMAQNRNLFVGMGAAPAADTYPGKHSLHVSKVAMAIGATLGLKDGDLIEMSMGCLIHDSGMLKVSRDLLELPRRLSPVEFLEITKHPAISYEMVRSLNELTTGARMVAYQMHERWNGSGYPRRREGRRIHFLARVAAVADVFVAAISPRPHRSALLPYYAIEEIIDGAQRKLFDPTAVRGLLETVSLFPIGSCVELSDGRSGRVIRANGALFARPVIEVAPPRGPRGVVMGEPEIVDLAKDSVLSVRRPLPCLPTNEVQFEAENWE